MTSCIVFARVQAFLPQMSAANERLQQHGVSESEKCCVEIVQDNQGAPASGAASVAAPPPSSSAQLKARNRAKHGPRGRRRMRDGSRQQQSSPAQAEQKPYVLMNVLVPKSDATEEDDVDKDDAMVEDTDDGEKQKDVPALQAIQQEIAQGMKSDESQQNSDGLNDEMREALLLQLFALQNNMEQAAAQRQDSSDSSDSSDSDDDDDDLEHSPMEM